MSSVGGKKRQMYVYIIFEWPLSAILKGVKYHTYLHVQSQFKYIYNVSTY